MGMQPVIIDELVQPFGAFEALYLGKVRLKLLL